MEGREKGSPGEGERLPQKRYPDNLKVEGDFEGRRRSSAVQGSRASITKHEDSLRLEGEFTGSRRESSVINGRTEVQRTNEAASSAGTVQTRHDASSMLAGSTSVTSKTEESSSVQKAASNKADSASHRDVQTIESYTADGRKVTRVVTKETRETKSASRAESRATSVKTSSEERKISSAEAKMQSSEMSQSHETSTAAGRSVKGRSPQPATTPTGRGRHNQSSFSLGEDVSISEARSGRSSAQQKSTSSSQISLDATVKESSASTREMASSLRQADALDLRGGSKTETLHGVNQSQGASHSSHMSGSQEEYRKWSAHHQQQSEQRRTSSSAATTSRSEQRVTSRGRGNASSITFHSEYDPWRDATITRRGEWQIVTPCPASLLETRASSYKSAHESKDHKFYLPVVD